MTLRSNIIHLAIAITLLTLTGCGTGPFSGSAAMRIEVEVYKGPLSLEPEIQLGELVGYLVEAQTGLIEAENFTRSVALNKDFPEVTSTYTITKEIPETKTWCKAVDAVGPWDQIDHFDCVLLQSLSKDTVNLLNKLDLAIHHFLHPRKQEPPVIHPVDISNRSYDEIVKMNHAYASEELKLENLNEPPPSSCTSLSKYQPKLIDALLHASRAAASMQSAAFRYATASTAGQSTNFKVRMAMVTFIVAASEYGNQIQARADALMKQLCPNGRDRRELPLSVHLRETEPTDFVHLYKWMDGTSYSFINKFIIGSGSVEDRIKAIDRLYADHFWSKINTVYASGRGETQMAFVKDDTGNWNLKSFDNDPSKLLDAYTKVAKTALDGAVKVAMRLAKDGVSGGGSELAQQLLALADQTALAKPTQPAQTTGTLSLDHLRARIAQQLTNKTEMDTLKAIDTTLQANFTTAQNAYTNAQKPAPTELTARDNAKGELVAHRRKVLTQWASLVDDHSNLVDLIGSTLKKK